MKIAVASDHRGYSAKQRVIVLVEEMGHQALDMGTDSPSSCDYTDTAYPAAKSVADKQADMGILICGSGIGMSIAANKVPGVRAALCHDELSAQMSRRHNNSNVLCLASDAIGDELMRRIVSSWLSTEFETNSRHQRRVDKIGMIEKGQAPAEANEAETAE